MGNRRSDYSGGDGELLSITDELPTSQSADLCPDKTEFSIHRLVDEEFVTELFLIGCPWYHGPEQIFVRRLEWYKGERGVTMNSAFHIFNCAQGNAGLALFKRA